MTNCSKCGKELKSVGTSRKNGKDHPDWETRNMHKKCWKEEEEKKRAIAYFSKLGCEIKRT